MMSDRLKGASRWSGRDAIAVLARWFLGGVLIYMGLSKAVHPVDFLKILRQYEMVDNHVLLNLIAATLPWFEIFCGSLLVCGIAVRGSALVSLAMLVPFSLVVLQRALAIHQAKAIPFCSVSFDCGCGGGEVIICHKLLENGVLILASALLVAGRYHRWCFRPELVKPAELTPVGETPR
jgi:uncharacterized membrane protein YphA (DoxX/SURF4 family)